MKAEGNNGGGNGGGGVIDEKGLDDTAGQANELFNAVRKAAINYEKKTAGAKLARDKGKAITG
ncbi:hypothetical protein [Yoonia sp. SS1-5]|uniref:Uncharacterized protein n=1 Tax=Yoonia rhodophyticola TaxID=3137370 RepID=A0AAN0MIC5_9RHOB